MILQLDRPIFIVGHARGGSTLLGAIINWHSHVGPRHNILQRYNDINYLLENILNPKAHLDYSDYLEQKRVWFDFFPGENVFTHMGKEIVVEHLNLDRVQIRELVSRLTVDFHEKRFLSKAPTNSFRVKIIHRIFLGAKFVALFRSGAEVVSSWGQRSYGFGKPVSWGDEKQKSLSYEKGIKIFARKWYETLEYLESAKKKWDS